MKDFQTLNGSLILEEGLLHVNEEGEGDGDGCFEIANCKMQI
jgi:hypothetical protein